MPTLFEKLTQAGLPVISATEDGAIESTAMTDAEKKQFDTIIKEHFGIVEPTVQMFDLPIQAPDFIVASPKPKTNPKEALAEALTEAKKPHGTGKSVALIVLDLMNYIEDLEKRIDALEKRK